jgi:uncharacterized membrane protein
MTRDRMIRFAAVLVGAAVMLVLEQQLGENLYIAMPGGIIAYIITRVTLGLLFSSRKPAK